MALHRLRCYSIRGIAPLGTDFEFSFDGEPTLIYGPNGSGKSSLLNAVTWILAGTVVTDGYGDAHEVPLYSPLGQKSRPTKIRNWPIVHTLPHTGDPGSAELDCWGELELRAETGSKTLHIRRRFRGELEESEDGVSWRPCPSLLKQGITPLDLQLSLLAATVFGRGSIESSNDTRHLLSMLLGYDSLGELGDTLTALASNLTKARRNESELIKRRKEQLVTKLRDQPGRLGVGIVLREDALKLCGDHLPSPEAIETSCTTRC